MLGRQRTEPLTGSPVGRHLRAQIADALVRCADIGHDDGFHVPVDLMVAVEPERRQAEPLAIDIGNRAVGSRRRTADVRPMSPHAAIA